jgi:hypothetical protein
MSEPVVKSIDLSKCFVVYTAPAYSSWTTLYATYYAGDTQEEEAAAQAAADRSAQELSEACPSLSFYIATLEDYMSLRESTARDQGSYDDL